jgi:hypothetical protein
MSSFTSSTLAPNFSLSDDEMELLQTAHRWVGKFCELSNAPTVCQIPEARGTTLEAWLLLNMAAMLLGFPSYPAEQVREAVPTPHDYYPRIVALKRRLETAPVAAEDSIGRTGSE